MKKSISVYALVLFLLGSAFFSAQSKNGFEKEKSEISTMLDAFNVAAAKAEYTTYFNYFAEESTFIGTDATEVLGQKSFYDLGKTSF